MDSHDINDIIAAWELMGQRCGAGWSRVTFKEFIASLPEGYFPDGLPEPLPEPKEPPPKPVEEEDEEDEEEEEEDWDVLPFSALPARGMAIVRQPDGSLAVEEDEDD